MFNFTYIVHYIMHIANTKYQYNALYTVSSIHSDTARIGRRRREEKHTPIHTHKREVGVWGIQMVRKCYYQRNTNQIAE